MFRISCFGFRVSWVSGSGFRAIAPCLLLSTALAAGQGAGGEWRDCLVPLLSHGSGPLEVLAPERERAVVVLVPACPEAFDLEVELVWSAQRGKKGGAELLAGPHAFGSSGYRIAVGPRGRGAAECRAPRLEPGHGQALELRVQPRCLEYWLGGSLVARCPAEAVGPAGVRLVVAPGNRATVKRCRLRVTEGASAGEAPIAGNGLPPRFVYRAAASRHEGRKVPDGLAAGGEAVELQGAGRGTPLLRGQDASLGLAGRYAAAFGLRGVEGSGNVWLEVATVEGQALASARVRLEELPADRYARPSVPFQYAAGALVEFRVAAERGKVRVDEVAVEGLATGRAADGRGDGPLPWRQRRARPLTEVWGRARPDPEASLAIAGVQRRLADGGWYEFRVAWRHSAASKLDGLAVDLWVACRDTWGIVRVFDLGAAYDAVPPSMQATAAWFDPALVPRYGPPVALFAQLYRKGTPVASASRKWGIPVDDVYIVGARRAGPLRQARPVTE